jgi:hypothetical protein
MRKCLDCEIELGQCGNAKKRCSSCQKEYRKLCWRLREQDPNRKEQNQKRYEKFIQNNPNKLSEYNKKYRVRYNKWRNSRYKNDVNFKLQKALRDRLYHAIASNVKSQHTMELLGCSTEQLKVHIESQFKDGMSWDNWSIKGWHIDHIRPCSSFDLSDPAQQKECFHYSNLQPLWAIENLKKSDSWDESPQDDIVF